MLKLSVVVNRGYVKCNMRQYNNATVGKKVCEAATNEVQCGNLRVVPSGDGRNVSPAHRAAESCICVSRESRGFQIHSLPSILGASRAPYSCNIKFILQNI